MARGTTRLGLAGALLAAAWLAAGPRAAGAWGPGNVGPPPPEAKTALVLPTRVPVDLAASRPTFDLLVANALQELGFKVVDAAQAAKELDGSAPDLAQARELYLGLRFEEALKAARAVRDAHLAHRGDLLGDPALTEAELLMVRVELDLGRAQEARELAVTVLEREPGLRLDPVDYPPAMQALWVAALDKTTARQPQEQGVEELAATARAAGAAYAVAAVAKRTPDGVDWLVLQIVPADASDKPSRHPMTLGARGTWARDVRQVLIDRFGPPPSEVAAAPVVPVAPVPADDGKKVWYKSWWFWSGVGLIVIGGAVTGIAIGVDKGQSGGSVNMPAQ
jgi:hypothetical protein